MKQQLSNLLVGVFNVLAGTASVASLPMAAASAWVPGGVCAFGLLALFYQCATGRREASEFAELDEKVNTLLRRDARASQELIDLLELPTDGVGPGENPLLLLYEALRQEIATDRLTPEELEQQVTVFLEANAGLEQRFASTLLDETNGLRELLEQQDAKATEQFNTLLTRFDRLYRDLAESFRQLLFNPELVLPLYAYSLEGSSSDRLHYCSRRVTLVGRENELERLHKFLEPAGDGQRDIRWWLWTGAAGTGKSRLALELCLQAIQRGYRAGFWRRKDPFSDWGKWKVNQPTLVVIDYVAERPEQVREAIIRLYENPQNLSRPLRLLLLERTADEERDPWYREFASRASTTEWRALESSRHDQPVKCEPLNDENDLWKIFEDVFADYEFSAPREQVMPLYRELDPEGRPLFAAAAAEAICWGRDVERIRNWSKADLVKSVIDREVARWREVGVDEAHINALVYATISRGCSAAELKELKDEGRCVPEEIDGSWLRLMSAYTSARDELDVLAIEPDMLGEWLYLERLMGRNTLADRIPRDSDKETKALLVAAFARHRNEASQFVIRSLLDFPDHDGISRTVPEQPEIDSKLASVLLLSRGWEYGDLGRTEDAINDWTALIKLKDVPASARAEAYFGLGVLCGQLGRIPEALANYSAIINMKDAPADPRARALVNRGAIYLTSGRMQDALNDWTAAIEMTDAPAVQRASALINRGAFYGVIDRPEKELIDCTEVIEMKDAPADSRLQAMLIVANSSTLSKARKCALLREARALASGLAMNNRVKEIDLLANARDCEHWP